MKKENNRATLKWIRSIVGKRQIDIAILAIIQVILGVSSVAYALLLRDLIDEAVAKDKWGFFYAALFFSGLVIFQILLRAITRFVLENTRVSLENRFKKRLFSSLLHKDFESVANVHSGEWMTRMTSDANIVANSAVQILPSMLGMSVRLIAALSMIMVLEPKFCYLIIPGGIALIIFTSVFRNKLKKMHMDVQDAEGKVRILFQEYLESLLVVRAYGVEKIAEDDADGKLQRYKKVVIKRHHLSNICNMGFGAMIHGAYVLGAVVCGYGILRGTMTYGTFTAVLQLISQVQNPFASITGYLPQYYNMLASAERLMEAEKMADRETTYLRDKEEVHQKYQKLASFGLKEAGFTYQPPAEEDNKTVVLKNINLQINKGEYVAFVGPSGCGKSTSLKLFLGLYPLDEGKRYVSFEDEIVTLDSSWQQLFAFVPQGNHLMSGTIREVVAFSDKDHMGDENRLKYALDVACATEFVSELDLGVETVLGERGSGLSEGQMQRLAIARAIYSENPVLLLDEATSALDEETERRLLQNLRAMTDKTVLIVTHRPAVLEICDKIATFSEKGVQVDVKCDKILCNE